MLCCISKIHSLKDYIMVPATRPLGHSGLGAVEGLCYTL